jgi:hypothetical protein
VFVILCDEGVREGGLKYPKYHKIFYLAFSSLADFHFINFLKVFLIKKVKNNVKLTLTDDIKKKR